MCAAYTAFLSTVLGGKKRKDVIQIVPYHCGLEVLHLRVNLVRTWFDHTRNRSFRAATLPVHCT
jgi:hypothetical protein